MSSSENKYCRCGEIIETERYEKGYFICLTCGEEKARRKLRTVVPLHKGNYILVENKEDLKNLDPKHKL